MTDPTLQAREIRQEVEMIRMGKSGWQSVNAWEKGHRPIPGPAQVAIGLMMEKA